MLNEIALNLSVEVFEVATIYISVIAFLTVMIVEVLKATELSSVCPPELMACATGVVLSELSIFVLNQFNVINGYKISYFIVAVFIGLIASLISMFGWEKISDIWQKVKYK